MLCKVCTSIFTRVRPRAGVLHRHHPNREELRKSRREGCYICSLIWGNAALQDYLTGREELTYDFETFCATDLEYDLVGLNFHCTLRPFIFKFKILSSANNSFVSPRPLSQNTFSKESFEQISEWLRNCLENHSNCAQRGGGKWQPKRLVSVGQLESGEDVRLCDCEHLKEHSSYVTLSHCWGQKPIFGLKKENILNLKAKIPILKLPKSFQDAIIITRKLGIEYIWIDSLCIIQDSHNDWFEESARMCSIYKHASLNLAATGFASGESGLFVSRNSDLLLPYTTTMSCSAATNRGENITTVDKSYWLIERDVWKTDVSQSPLNRRAWVLQERALSPRTVHFGKRQLFWECKRLTASEVFPKGYPPDLPVETTIIFPKHFDLPLVRQTQGPLTKLDLKHDLYRRWELITENYTTTNLSYPTDKLIAISGLAKEFRQILGNDQYLAGLWKDNLPNELLWYVLLSAPSKSKSNTTCASYRAPTWSWASIDGPILHMLFLNQTQDAQARIQILEAKTITDNGVDTMDVTGGLLRIKGFLKRVRMEIVASKVVSVFMISTKNWAIGNSKMHSELDFHCDCRGLSKLKNNTGEFDLDLVENIVDQPDVPAYGVVYCLLVQSSDMDSQHFGLVLAPTGSKGTFRRIGLFVHSYSKCTTERYIWEKSNFDMEETHYHSSDGLGRLTICVV